LIQDIDTSKVRLWLFTNAYVTHGKRVVKLLKIDDLFEGMTYCDYSSEKFVCKPQTAMFDKVMREAGITSNQKCYFVGTWALRALIDFSGANYVRRFIHQL
jgi:pyrimidine and pyridine-specific 5'-nucleotidase